MKWMVTRTAVSVLLLFSCTTSSFSLTDRTYTSDANWFVSVGAGEQYPQYDSSINVNNGSGFSPPYDQDVYNTHKDSQPVIAAAAGYRWNNDDQALSAYSVGLFYQHFFQSNAGCCITQYSTPGFTNYRYNWNIYSNILLAYGKVDLYRFNFYKPYLLNISPYINAGIGAAFNNSSYNETALPGVTARTSPGFRSMTTAQFAYNAGVGMDFQFTRQFIFSVAYEYMNLGTVKTGNGTLGWSNQSLRLNPYQSNEVLVSLNYLI